ncbi:MAG: MOSC domain-containing protein [Proteobacteria bacterium]|nr:MOSC domain-containing protein [Pseudomonadota bacterium]
MIGRITGLARRPVSRAPMEELQSGLLTIDKGLFGDCKGSKFPERQITIMSAEDWQAAMNELSGPAGTPELPWTARRANVLVEGIRLPRGIGSVVALGNCMLKVTEETYPCSRMNEVHPGLLSALAQEWRGGITCKVLTGGPVALGLPVRIVAAMPEFKVRLPA